MTLTGHDINETCLRCQDLGTCSIVFTIGSLRCISDKNEEATKYVPLQRGATICLPIERRKLNGEL